MQPFVERTAHEFRRAGGCLLVAKRNDRSGRQTWGMAPLWIAVEETESYLFDEDGLRHFDELQSTLMFLRGASAQKQAQEMPKQTRREQQNRSGKEMIDGQALYHSGPPLPPGFGTCWLNSSTGAPESRVVFLDGDDSRPSDAQVAYGLSEVRDEDGNRVDQVANVRWLLSRLGHPEWPQSRLAMEMIRRRFSTQSLRSRRRSAAAAIDSVMAGRKLLETVYDNLDTYESGVLVRRLTDEFEVRITGCIPPDGPWATAEDFARIRDWKRRNVDRANRAASLNMVGVTAHVGDEKIRLLTRRKSSCQYWLVRESDYPQRSRPVRHRVWLSARRFNDSIIDGLAAAGEQSLRAVLPEDLAEGENAELGELQAERTLCHSRLEGLRHREATLLARLEATDADGSPLVTGTLLRRLNDEYNDLADHLIADCADELASIDASIDELIARRPEHVGVSAVLHLAASLRDPYDVTYRQLWLRVITGLRFEIIRDSGFEWISWKGWLRLGDDEHEVLIPFSGRHSMSKRRRNAATRVDVEQWLEQLASGTAFDAIRLGRRSKARQLLAEQLDVPVEHALFSIDDPRILRVTCAALRDRDASAEGLADELGESVDLVTRVREVLAEDRTRWRIREHTIHTALHVLAAQGQAASAAAVLELSGSGSRGNIYNVAAELRREDGRWSTQRKRGYRFQCGCGSHAAAPLAIPEPLGAVCLGCRRDAAGLVWPADPYDRYVAHPEMWAAHGFEFATTEEVSDVHHDDL